ncbi:biotin/lipoyl-binding protein [Burkholderia cenocepacia]|uniref:biotin/lipoyl-binding protein n=1 Tax=Burkholderia cenocepacia TaxID=95486 RepID=UPI000DD5477C|nr:HlyD family secretion protein [Burkholderia cenocepacia]MCW3505797.1 HlyD family secretion protein [Burkholderia cenocepacia]MCW3513355.1 HlyD family secretion protein [Burkholderia cenocepacia]MCW3520968.1 HlyD family secretion protein [Burkholderia cenocepacia]MCW3536109.1 HlyD family secretion protein [Burkholderia cenocepacia]MCW3551164.1 HlyD family secretion protein [Burkholderia cenocepacia]
MKRESVIRFALTFVVVLIAAFLAFTLWRYYMYSPWTRDGRVRANVVQIAPDVTGLVTNVRVQDNQLVKRGDVLLVIDQDRYRFALDQARANLAAAKASEEASIANIAAATATVAARRTDYLNYQAQAQRRLLVPKNTVVSSESLEAAVATARSALANLHQAEASLKQARASYLQAQAAVAQNQAGVQKAELDLTRTEVRAPVDGYVTNVQVRAGDYATTGAQQLALVDSHSFYLYGYLEETKLPAVRVGDNVDVRLLAGGIRLKGRITGIARGITDRDNPNGSEMLSDVNPVFNWVRLAQRIPIRIAIDPAQMPADTALVAGMTATITVQPGTVSPVAVSTH